MLDSFDYAKGEGLWRYYDPAEQERDLSHVNKMGSFVTDKAYGFTGFLGSREMSRDDQIGSVGGGNHFVEIQRIKRITNGSIANAWGLKENQIVIMIHTGSVSIGHHSGNYIREILKNIYPKNRKHPENGIYPLVLNDENANSFSMFWSLLHNAANYAFANRLMLGLMTKASLIYELGEFEFKLLYDAPHNYIWEEEIDGVKGFLHRKGSCTAKGLEQMQNTSFAYTGEPVFIPGSMGASSFILAGRGNRDSLFSASHGAGRCMSRGKASKISDEVLNAFMNKFRVVTPIDPKRPDLTGREDILSKWREEIKKEAPFAYKEISPVIRSHTDYNMADIVAETEPILTIKG